MYLLFRQTLRSTADATLIQMADEGAVSLSHGQTPDFFIVKQRIDLATSLSPFTIIYNKKQLPIAANVVLDGVVPTLPTGVLIHADGKKINKVTWQPKNKVRAAIIVIPFSGKQKGYILVGRSLLEVEKQNQIVLVFSLLSWGVSIGVLCGLFFI